jgi:hypothetical protein
MTLTGLVAGCQFAGLRIEVCCKAYAVELVGQVITTVFVAVSRMRNVGGLKLAGLNTASCINQAPELSPAVAL